MVFNRVRSLVVLFPDIARIGPGPSAYSWGTKGDRFLFDSHDLRGTT